MYSRPLLTLTLAAILGASPVGAGGKGIAHPYRLSSVFGNGDSFMRVRLLGALQLPTIEVDGYPMLELSGLGWDEDEAVLYALSDEGRVFHLEPMFTDGILDDVEVLGAYALRDEDGEPLRGSAADAEGLALENHRNGRRGDTRLIISFERRPRIVAHDPRGTYEREYALPRPLRSPSAYRGRNRALEAVASHPGAGIITAPELPIGPEPSDMTLIYGLDGSTWAMDRYPAPNSALVAIETLADGSLLTLERSFSSIWQPLVIVLRRTEPLPAPGRVKRLTAEEIVILSSYDGWHLDNFEGLTLHRDMRFFLVSDDNANFFQRTLLLYLEVLEHPAKALPIPDPR